MTSRKKTASPRKPPVPGEPSQASFSPEPYALPIAVITIGLVLVAFFGPIFFEGKTFESSDHVAYMAHGIPAVMLITWPDMWYHSSEDTPDKQDPTQYKRAAAVGLGSLAVLATGTDEMAARVLNENMGRGLARLGESHTKGLGYLADVSSEAELNQAYREALNAVRHQVGVEQAVVRSARVMWTDPGDGSENTEAFVPLIDGRAAPLLDEVRMAYELQARQRGIRARDPELTAAEREAASLVVEQIEGGSRPSGGPSLPDEFNAEFRNLLGDGASHAKATHLLL